jgi:ATP-dependent Lhr-like helicase
MEAPSVLLQTTSASASDESTLPFLPAAVRAWVSQRFGQPTPIQRTAWPALAVGRNVLLSAPTGSGKTLAAFLPLLGELLFASPISSVRVLYVAPLKALAADIRRNLRSYLAGISAFLSEARTLPRIALRTGDTSARDRQRLWTDPPDVLLTTPESLALLLTHPEASDLFGGLRAVVVDEIHALAGGKRGADLSLSLERLETLVPAPLQRIGLSATSTPLDEAARFLVGVDRPCVLAHVADVAPLELRVKPLPPGPRFLAQLLDEIGPLIEANRSTLVFTNTRALAERVGWGLRRRHPDWDEQVAVHHSSLAALRRRRVEKRLKRGRLRAVVSSTSLELGIDIGSVDQVILVHPPGDVVRLLQRVGRAGHAPGQARRGLVLTSGPAELLEAAVTAASGQLGQCEPLRIAEAPLDVLCQQLLGMAATGRVEPESAFALVRRAAPFRQLSRADFDACLAYLNGSEGALPARLRQEEGACIIQDERTLRLLRRNLGTILAEETCEVALEVGPAVPDEVSCPAQPDLRTIGDVDEVFAERLQPGDRFLLDGLCLEFRRLEHVAARQGALRLIVEEVPGRPVVPRWAGEGLPLSAELARRLFLFRARAAEALREGSDALIQLLRSEYDLEGEAVVELADLFLRQETLSEIPDPATLLIEIVPAQALTTYYLHTLLNRKGNDALARILTVRLTQRHPEAASPLSLIADLGLALYVRGSEELTPEDFRALLRVDSFEEDIRRALADSLVLRQRFQRVALTGLMLLRHPLGRKRRVGGRDWAQRRLFEQVRARLPDFVLLRQAEREVLAEVCDVTAARTFLEELPRLAIHCRRLTQPSPFVEGWTQPGPSEAAPVPSPEETLRRLHETLTGRPAG